ncbi:MAG: beta-glucoside-specific PTS transporter subunit IIABC [Lachnospiraceae bacterium]|nr:beta-glucoside-specific PTS transporter subunit IIABC [Lachnospiraceae bacterium]
MDYKALATTIVDHIGGKDNVISVVHCATRLRFTLKDDKKADTDLLKKTKGVMAVVSAGGQYQIVIGPDVPQVYQEVIAIGGFEAAGPVQDDDAEKEDTRSQLSKLLEGIASIFQPIIPAITGAGLLKAFMALFVALGVLKSSTQTYIILNTFADAAFYFMPMLLAVSCAKKFKCNQGTAMALAGILVYPSFITLLAGEEAVLFLGILPVTKATYTSSVIPIILGVWFMSYVEHFMQKISPKAIKFFSVPLVSLLVGGTALIVVLGPIGAWVSNLINLFFTWLNANAAWLVPTVVGIFTPLLVMTGTHYGLIPIGTNNLASAGWDTVVGPGMLVSNVAQGAAGLAMSVRSKNPDTKQQASSAGLTGVLGITEPVLYGVNLKFSFPLYAAMIGGGVGGLYLGITKVARFAAGSPGLLVLPAYIPTEQAQTLGYTMSNLVNAVIGTVIAMVVSFVVCYILFGVWQKNGKLPVEEYTAPGAVPASEPVVAAASAATDAVSVQPSDTSAAVLTSPLKGTLMPLTEVKDEVFSSGALGQGIAVEPAVGEVYAPCNGVISTFFETGHAIGISADDGAEVLIHVGMDTVNLKGEGFTPKAKEGDRVKAGDLLLKFDIPFIKSKGFSVVTPVVISNSDDYGTIDTASAGKVEVGSTIITYK